MAVSAFCFLLLSCNDHNSTTDQTGNGNDSSSMDTRRNSTDTVNYITKDSGNKSQETIDPNPPTNSRY